MTDKFITTKYYRDKNSKALVSVDRRALEKHQKQKNLVKTVEDQNQHINNLSNTIEKMQKQIDALLEKN